MKLDTMIAVLDKTFPKQDACSWDYVGWQLKVDGINEVTKILVTLDISKTVVDKAIVTKTQLIICHHPLIFANSLTEVSSYKQKLFQTLKQNNINVYVIHTNFDKSKKGMNYQIAKDLNFSKINYFDDENLSVISYGNNLKIADFIVKIKSYFNFEKIIFFENRPNEVINNIVLAAGAGGSLIENISNNDCNNLKIDLFITGEMKWNHCLEAADKGINTLIIGHQMEEKFIDIMTKFLQKITVIDKKIIIISHYYSLPKFL